MDMRHEVTRLLKARRARADGAVLGVTERTIQRDWAKAKELSYAELRA
jgi:hypothetical protein